MLDDSGVSHPRKEVLERAWAKAGEVEDVLASRELAREPSRDRVGYRSTWLVRYDHDLDPADQRLKRAEAELVERTLRRRDLWGSIGSYLDIGTCTGRYVRHLREAVATTGRIVGIDNNLESILTTRENLRRRHPEDERIAILLRDFRRSDSPIPAAPFDLVTCMMSTISHFGKGRTERHEDPLQEALRRMSDLLATDGLLVLSFWSRRACEERALLSIYDQRDRDALAAWTPGADELRQRLATAGLVVAEGLQPDPRLDLWVCQHR